MSAEIFILCYFAIQTICIVWFYSPFRLTISKVLFSREVTTFDDFETLLLLKSPFFGKLLSCYICFSFWTSLIVGLCCVFLVGAPLWWPGLLMITCPSLCYMYKSLIS